MMTEDELMAREDKCRKSLRTLGKAIFMRLFVTAILLWAVIAAKMEAWVVGLMALVLIVNLSGLFPLVREWRAQRTELKTILAQYE